MNPKPESEPILLFCKTCRYRWIMGSNDPKPRCPSWRWWKFWRHQVYQEAWPPQAGA